MTNKRQTLIQKIKYYQCKYASEGHTALRMIEFLESTPDCFLRSYQKGHFAGSAWLLNKTKSHVLLTHHKKLNMWLQLGGHADGDENIARVALREASEESGIESLKIIDQEIFDLDIHTIPARKDEPQHEHFDIRFLIQCTETHDFIVSEESHNLAWIEISKLSEITEEESMLRMANKCIRSNLLTELHK